MDDGNGIPELMKKKLFDFEMGGTHSLYFAKEILQVTGADMTDVGTPRAGAMFEITFPTGTFRKGPEPDESSRFPSQPPISSARASTIGDSTAGGFREEKETLLTMKEVPIGRKPNLIA